MVEIDAIFWALVVYVDMVTQGNKETGMTAGAERAKHTILF